MKITLTLDPDIEERLKQEVALGDRSMSEIVNQALRRDLAILATRKTTPFKVLPHSSPFVAGIDPGKLNQWIDADDAASAAFQTKMEEPHPRQKMIPSSC